MFWIRRVLRSKVFLDELLDANREFHGIERLDNVVSGSNLKEFDALRGTILGTEHDDRDMLEEFVLLDPFQKLIAPHSWHTNIGDDEVGGIALLQLFHPLEAVGQPCALEL